MKNIIVRICLTLIHAWRALEVGYRTRVYRFLFKEFGKHSCVYGKITVYEPQKISIGKNSTLNHGVMLNAQFGTITIGDHVRLSPYVIINTGGLNLAEQYEKRRHIGKDVVIEHGAWIGTGAIINSGVRIGRGSVVGAGAVVVKNVEPFILTGGVPARKIKTLPQASNHEE